MESPLTLGQPTEEELEARREAGRLGERFLVYRDDEGRQVIHALDRGARRSRSAAAPRPTSSIPWDPEMSRLHAELELRAGEWTISDDGLSQNGTWVNGLRLTGRRRLNDGDLVRVGRTLIAFCDPVPVGTGPTLVPRRAERHAALLRAAAARPARAVPPAVQRRRGHQPGDRRADRRGDGIALEAVASELDHLGRALGLEDMPSLDQRAEIALLAMRSGLVSADEGG